MLELRPSCECCNKNLPPQSVEAVICTFECTFCLQCAQSILKMKCPNCEGELVRRPIRSESMLQKYPASSTRVVKDGGCSFREA